MTLLTCFFFSVGVCFPGRAPSKQRSLRVCWFVRPCSFRFFFFESFEERSRFFLGIYNSASFAPPKPPSSDTLLHGIRDHRVTRIRTSISLLSIHFSVLSSLFFEAEVLLVPGEGHPGCTRCQAYWGVRWTIFPFDLSLFWFIEFFCLVCFLFFFFFFFFTDPPYVCPPPPPQLAFVLKSSLFGSCVELRSCSVKPNYLSSSTRALFFFD